MGQIWGYFNVELGSEIGLIWVVSLSRFGAVCMGIRGGNRVFGWGKLGLRKLEFAKILDLNSRVTRAIFQDGRCKSLKHGTRW